MRPPPASASISSASVPRVSSAPPYGRAGSTISTRKRSLGGRRSSLDQELGDLRRPQVLRLQVDQFPRAERIRPRTYASRMPNDPLGTSRVDVLGHRAHELHRGGSRLRLPGRAPASTSPVTAPASERRSAPPRPRPPGLRRPSPRRASRPQPAAGGSGESRRSPAISR